jgi:hypothetical protein
MKNLSKYANVLENIRKGLDLSPSSTTLADPGFS